MRVSICHCLTCQQRTGSAFGVQARFHVDQVTNRTGVTTVFARTGESGVTITHHFCPVCGATVFYTMNGSEPPYNEDFVAITVGSFADPSFPTPTVSGYEERRHPWVKVLEGTKAEHFD